MPSVVEFEDFKANNSYFRFSLELAQTFGELSVQPRDIVDFDGTDFSLFFDGSDVGLTSGKINAFDVISDTEILISFNNPVAVPGLGTIDDTDIVRFTATSLGENTAGTFSLEFDGGNVGLDNGSENIDAIRRLADGSLLLSTANNLNPGSGVIAAGEDIVQFIPTATGEDTAGSFSLYLDGSDIGLTASSVDAFSINAAGEFFLSTKDIFTDSGLSAEGKDVFDFIAASTGETTSGSFASAAFFDGDAFGLDSNSNQNIIGIDISGNGIVVPDFLSLTIDATSIPENGGSVTATVTRTGDVTQALTVGLVSDDTSEATVPATVTIEADQTSASFEITGVDDDIDDDTQTITVTASATGLKSASATLDITDNEPLPIPDTVHFSLKLAQTLDGLSVQPMDIVEFDGTDFNLLFDGSDVGLNSSKINAFDIISDTEILMSFNHQVTLPGLGIVNDTDIVRFTATSLGEDTAGNFSLEFDGSDVGLENGGEDIDAINLLPDGSLLLSTIGKLNPGDGTIAAHEDIVQFVPTAIGETTAGSFSLYVDGSDIGLTDSGIDAFSFDAAGDFFFSTNNSFASSELSAEGEDIFGFSYSSIGETTNGSFAPEVFFDGDAFGLDSNPNQNIMGIDIVLGAPPNFPKISIDDVTANEADGEATFTVGLDRVAATVITVDYTTHDGLAVSGENGDYIATSGTLTFTPNTTTQTITVAINDDLETEGDEDFIINLSNAVNAEVLPYGQGIGSAKIIASDRPGTIVGFDDFENGNYLSRETGWPGYNAFQTEVYPRHLKGEVAVPITAYPQLNVIEDAQGNEVVSYAAEDYAFFIDSPYKGYEDYFGIYSRAHRLENFREDPLFDDTVSGIPYSTDDPSYDVRGIVKSDKLDPFFAIGDTRTPVNKYPQVDPPTNDVGAYAVTWEMDISNFEDLYFSIDMAAMGRFANRDGNHPFAGFKDNIEWYYVIDDGEPESLLKAVGQDIKQLYPDDKTISDNTLGEVILDENGYPEINKDGRFTTIDNRDTNTFPTNIPLMEYIMEDGSSRFIISPLKVFFPSYPDDFDTVPGDTLLNNDFRTFTRSISGTGSTLKIIVYGGHNNDLLATVFDNLEVTGNPISPEQIPVAQDDFLQTLETDPLTGNVLNDNGNGADSDLQGDSLTVTDLLIGDGVGGYSPADLDSPITLISGALLTLEPDGVFNYDPNGQFDTLSMGQTAADEFMYRISDGNGGFDLATATITIDGVA